MAGKKLDDRLNIFFSSDRLHLNSGTFFRMIEILTSCAASEEKRKHAARTIPIILVVLIMMYSFNYMVLQFAMGKNPNIRLSR